MTDLPADLLQHRVPDSREAPSLNWGILGPGWIAERFIASVQEFTTQNVVAIASRGLPRAQALADRFGIDTAYGSYQDLVSDARVDVVYVATLHSAHYECTLMALEAGKHILVEKLFAINAEQARSIARIAEKNRKFCMEALWTFFLPIRLRRLPAALLPGNLRMCIVRWPHPSRRSKQWMMFGRNLVSFSPTNWNR